LGLDSRRVQGQRPSQLEGQFGEPLQVKR